MSNRGMVKLIHADNFFPSGDAEVYCRVAKSLKFQPTAYGLEVPDFNMILKGVEPILSRVLGERIQVEPKSSGVFRRPLNNIIHFEKFSSPDEWCFIVALERTVVNLWHHISDPQLGDMSKSNSSNVFEGCEFNYFNPFEWKIHTNIVLEPNQGIFIRPWVFHSLEDGMVQYYRLIADKKYRVLVMGLPESSRRLVSLALTEKIQNSKLLISSEQRVIHKDVDFTAAGQDRHCYRMLDLARTVQEECAVIDMVCPTDDMRSILNPDFIVYVADCTETKFTELSTLFVEPNNYDYLIKEFNNEAVDDIVRMIKSKRS